MDNSILDTQQATLYDRLGGEPSVRKIVSDVLDKNLSNAKISHHFQKVDMDQLKQLVFQFFSMGTGGPHQYSGRDMITAHTGLNISENDFEIANDDTVEALKENGVGENEINEVMAILNSMQNDIVGR